MNAIKPKSFDIHPTTGHIFFAAHNLAFIRSMRDGITPLQYMILEELGQLGDTYFHSKPVTKTCQEAVLYRFHEDYPTLGIGTALSHEIKGRMFAAKDLHGNDVVIANFYMADSDLDERQAAACLPKKSGQYLLNVPNELFQEKKDKRYDRGDLMSLTNPLDSASNLLGLGLGEINPFSVIARAKENGVKLLCVYDERLTKWSEYATNNVGAKTMGSYTRSGKAYVDLAVSKAADVEISGVTVPGFIVAKIADRSDDIQIPEGVAELYTKSSQRGPQQAGEAAAIFKRAWSASAVGASGPATR